MADIRRVASPVSRWVAVACCAGEICAGLGAVIGQNPGLVWLAERSTSARFPLIIWWNYAGGLLVQCI